MSNTAPILILQMQRMGDLILTFPLLGWLQRRFPERPLWVVAEQRFFQELMPMAPKATFFPPEAAERLRTVEYSQVINLSHRPDAAQLSGSVRTEQRLGAYRQGEATYIDGFWLLYRASLVNNNRHNRFHWGDMNLMDSLPPEHLSGIGHPEATRKATQGRVGLFVGASEVEKRPDAVFWGELARALLRKGLRPLFLGGPDDRPLAQSAAQMAGMPGANLCGRFSLRELVDALHGLDVCITPDTGPMHLAAWAGTPVLNLSMGNVNAWETGPISSGHHILRSTSSCVGCWRCLRPQPACRDTFQPPKVAALAHALLNHPERLSRMELPGLALYRTARDARGMYVLERADGGADTSRDALGNFWREWFLACASPRFQTDIAGMLSTLELRTPPLAAALRLKARRLHAELARRLRSGTPLADGFWTAFPPLLRPLTGYLDLYLQNAEYALPARQATLDMAARFVEALEL